MVGGEDVHNTSLIPGSHTSETNTFGKVGHIHWLMWTNKFSFWTNTFSIYKKLALKSGGIEM